MRLLLGNKEGVHLWYEAAGYRRHLFAVISSVYLSPVPLTAYPIPPPDCSKHPPSDLTATVSDASISK